MPTGRSTSRRPWRLTPSPITWPAAATTSGWRTRGRRAIATSSPRSSSRTASSVVASDRLLPELANTALYADAYADVIVGEDGASWGVADALVGEQGPNYAL